MVPLLMATRPPVTALLYRVPVVVLVAVTSPVAKLAATVSPVSFSPTRPPAWPSLEPLAVAVTAARE